jgi:excisionase family DNA binding protein
LIANTLTGRVGGAAVADPTDTVQIPTPDGWLVLTSDEYERHLVRPLAPVTPPEPLMDADALAAVLKVPVSWIEQAAREGRIPSLQFGRWRRFKRSEVESAVTEGLRSPEPVENSVRGKQLRRASNGSLTDSRPRTAREVS